jgi:hypothetical protein
MEEEYDNGGEQDDEQYRIHEYDEDFVPETKFMAERDAYLRTHAGFSEEGTEQVKMLFGKNMAEAYRELYRKGYTDTDRFRILISVANSQLGKYDLFIGKKDIEIIKDVIIDRAPTKINYINTTCLLLGYYITNGGKPIINKEKFDKVLKILPKIPDTTAPDVIRYARFWTTKQLL